MLTGRPTPAPGEPLFLPEDTELAVALAMEERETCQQCGMPIAICSDPANQFAFEGVERMCWPGYGLAMHRNKSDWQNKTDETRNATMLSARFRAGVQPDVNAGLDLAGQPSDEGDQDH